jgi:hypothetical protein
LGRQIVNLTGLAYPKKKYSARLQTADNLAPSVAKTTNAPARFRSGVAKVNRIFCSPNFPKFDRRFAASITLSMSAPNKSRFGAIRRHLID